MQARRWVQASGSRLGAGLAARQVPAAGASPGGGLIDSGLAVELIDLGLIVGQQRQQFGLCFAQRGSFFAVEGARWLLLQAEQVIHWRPLRPLLR